MEKLRTVIGPAPSELPLPTLIKRLDEERGRIARVLARPIKTRKTAKAKERAKRASTRVGDAQLALIAEATGIPIEDLKRGGR